MFANVQVLTTDVPGGVLVECDRCGPVGMWTGVTHVEAATDHLCTCHGAHPTGVKEQS